MNWTDHSEEEEIQGRVRAKFCPKWPEQRDRHRSAFLGMELKGRSMKSIVKESLQRQGLKVKRGRKWIG